MSSYVAHKSLAFRDLDDVPLVIRKRSEGRLKTYPSATDARAWCVDTDDRRQHILDLIRANHEMTLGKYIPIEVLIDTLLANRTSDCDKLRQQLGQLQKLLDAYMKLELTPEQQKALAGFKQQMGVASARLDGLSDSDSKARSGMSSGAGSSKGSGGVGGTGGTGGGRGPGGPGGTKGVGSGGGALGSSAEYGAEGYDSSLGTPIPCGKGIPCPKKTTKTPPTTPPAGMDRISPETSSEASSRTSPGGATTLSKSQPIDEKDCLNQIIKKDAEIIALKNAFEAKQEDCDQQHKIAKTAIEQLENMKDIIEERDHLKKQLESSLHELNTLKGRFEDPCVAEIAALENEIERLRKADHLSPEEEAEVIRKEVDVLKKYCAKLSKIQEENNKLKNQVSRLQEISGIPSNYEDEPITTNDPNELKNSLRELRRKLAKLNEIMDERDKFKARVRQLEAELLTYGDLPQEVEIFRQRSELLDDVLDERNSLQKRLDRLRGLEKELVELKKRADRADELERQLQLLNNEVGHVRRESAAEIEIIKSQTDKDKREIDNIRTERDLLRKKTARMSNADNELERLKYKSKEADVLKIERDRLKVKCEELCKVDDDFKKMAHKCQCMEGIKSERDQYKSKCEELLGLECECNTLKAEVRKYKAVDDNRNQLVKQLMECECQMADQEEEIQRLVCHIDRMSQGSNQQQDRVHKALSDMRAELEQKNFVISASEEHLAGVQSELKSTITGVSNETSLLKARIEELEIELEAALNKIKEHQGEIANYRRRCSGEAEEDAGVCECNEMAPCGDENFKTPRGFENEEHVESALKDSKIATQRVTEELSKQYDEWDSKKGADAGTMKTDDTLGSLLSENQALRRHSQEVQDVAKNQINDCCEQLQKANERISQLETSLAKQAATSEAGVSAKTDDCDELRRQNAELLKQLDSAKKEVSDMMQVIKNSEKKAGTSDLTQTDLDKDRKEKADLGDTVKKLQSSITEMASGGTPLVSVGTYATDDAINKLATQLEAKQTQDKDVDATEDTSPLTDEIAALKEELKVGENEIDKIRRESAAARASLKSQFDRDMNNMNNKYNDGVAKLQGSHEEVLKDLNQEHDNEVENLRSELRKSLELNEKRKSTSASQQTLKSKTTLNADNQTEGVCTCGSGFEAILYKILNSGMQALTFDELKMLHTKTCEATAVLLGNSRPSSRDSGRHPSEGDKQQLLRRINALENDLLKKQRIAQQKVGALQIAVKMERQRLEQLRNTLDSEKRRNSSLLNRIKDQSRAVVNMQMEKEIMRKRSSFHEEQLQDLLTKSQGENQKMKRLEDDLYRSKQKHKNDCDALECMRLKLEKSINNELMLKMQMDQRTFHHHHPTPGVVQDHQPSSGIPHSSRAQSFYTELNVQDIRSKRNYVQECSLKHRDRPGQSSVLCERCRQSTTSQFPHSSDTDA